MVALNVPASQAHHGLRSDWCHLSGREGCASIGKVQNSWGVYRGSGFGQSLGKSGSGLRGRGVRIASQEKMRRTE